MMKTMVFLPFCKKLQYRHEAPYAVIEIIPGSCYRVHEKEDSKPEIVHHDLVMNSS